MTTPTYDPMVREEYAAELLGVGRETLRRWRMDGSGPMHHVVPLDGRCRNAVRYRVSDLRAFANADATGFVRWTDPGIRRVRAGQTVRPPKGGPKGREKTAPEPAGIVLPKAVEDRARESARRLGMAVEDYVAMCLEAFR